MSKNKSTKTVATETNSTGPGRPKSKVSWPMKRFTMADAFEHNGCNIKPKGRVCKLVVIKAKDRDLIGEDSFLVKMPELAETTSGKGRKQFVYLRRSLFEGGKKLAARSKAGNVSVDIAPVDSSVEAVA
jgi:hypothetical protein